MKPEFNDIDDLEEIDLVIAPPEEPVVIFGKEINAVLFEMITGIIIFGLTCQLLIVWFVDDPLGFSLGLWLGIIVSVGYTGHMWWSIEQYLYMGLGAPRYAKKHVMFRYMAVCVVLILAGLVSVTFFLAAVLGMMGVKAGAFMQPFVRKLCRRSE
ncbi:MAG: hypothetical protein FWC09_11355 [Lachnospiraceae bacterium]|nr:hypothetical protein [Lachnospiraceae bacterium]